MRSKILVFLFVFLAVTVVPSKESSAGVLPGGPSLTIGGQVFTDFTNLIVLFAVSTTGWSTFRKVGASSGYQVTSGKTFTIWAIQCSNDSTNGISVGLGYGDTDSGMYGSVPTNPVYPGGVTASQALWQTNQGPGNAIAFNPRTTTPATKYPFIHNPSANNGECYVYGYES